MHPPRSITEETVQIRPPSLQPSYPHHQNYQGKSSDAISITATEFAVSPFAPELFRGGSELKEIIDIDLELNNSVKRRRREICVTVIIVCMVLIVGGVAGAVGGVIGHLNEPVEG